MCSQYCMALAPLPKITQQRLCKVYTPRPSARPQFSAHHCSRLFSRCLAVSSCPYQAFLWRACPKMFALKKTKNPEKPCVLLCSYSFICIHFVLCFSSLGCYLPLPNISAPGNVASPSSSVPCPRGARRHTETHAGPSHQ